jgi:hypothetical protein
LPSADDDLLRLGGLLDIGGIALEDLHGLGDPPDAVAVIGVPDLAMDIARGQRLHGDDRAT